MTAVFDAALPDELCRWYRAARRALPWRATRDPYRVWVSEVMLQQTRVETVRGAYRRFLERFPDVGVLAAASEADVLARWSGLGYYRRARALHAAAGEIVAQHGGRFPSDPRAALALTGVGRYTAGAVLSIAYGRAEPIVDGNVARVFARWFLLEDELGTGALERRLWSLAAAAMPAAGEPGAGANPGDWNQALMELGATICTPTSPACQRCPVAELCGARRAGRVDELPRKRPKAPPTPVRLEALVIEHDGARLVVQRPPSGRMASLWEPPLREVGTQHLWPADFPALGLAGFELEPGDLARVKHSITRYTLDVVVRRARLVGASEGSNAASPARWVRPGDEVALTGLAKKLAQVGQRHG
ncbi:MAG: A/G-specific adenine glycosylase [Planctomycetota bacterium]